MVNKKNTKKVPGMALSDVRGWIDKEISEMSPEKRAEFNEFQRGVLGGLTRAKKVEHTLWCKTKSFFKTLGWAIVDVIFLLSVLAIFGSLFLIIWDPVMANVQLLGTAILVFAFFMTMVGIFNRD